jgi:hypothetical protein
LGRVLSRTWAIVSTAAPASSAALTFDPSVVTM